MELLSLGSTPIDSDHPTGLDIRYDPDFEQLQAEIDKLSSPSSASTINWKSVVKLASEILSQKSKDLLVASYLAVGLIYTQQMEGFGIGLKIYSDLVTQFWEDLYPSKKRMRGRSRAIEWWLEKSEIPLGQLEIKPIPVEEHNQLKENIEKLDSALREQLEEPVSMSTIQRFIDALPAIQPAPEKSAEEESEKGAKKVLEKEAAEVIEEITTSKDAQKVLNLGIQKFRQVAAYLAQEEPSNPQVYRLTRIAIWSNIVALPIAENGKTRIPPPTAQIKNILTDLESKAEWENLLKSAEARLSQFIFWLDLNRYVAEALSKLGDPYQAAQEAVCQETAFFINRLSGLEKLSFSDGTPFADNETKRWLKEIAFKDKGGEGAAMASGSVLTGQEEGRMEKEIQKARDLAKNKKLFEAITILQQHLHNSFSKKERLLWRLALSQLLINAKQTKIAVPHLEQVLQDIKEYRLEEWDPKLALQGLEIVWTGFDAQPDEASQSKANETLNRIARIDPVEALRLKG